VIHEGAKGYSHDQVALGRWRRKKAVLEWYQRQRNEEQIAKG